MFSYSQIGGKERLLDFPSALRRFLAHGDCSKLTSPMKYNWFGRESPLTYTELALLQPAKG
jgi:hypothetical protein